MASARGESRRQAAAAAAAAIGSGGGSSSNRAIAASAASAAGAAAGFGCVLLTAPEEPPRQWQPATKKAAVHAPRSATPPRRGEPFSAEQRCSKQAPLKSSSPPHGGHRAAARLRRLQSLPPRAVEGGCARPPRPARRPGTRASGGGQSTYRWAARISKKPRNQEPQPKGCWVRRSTPILPPSARVGSSEYLRRSPLSQLSKKKHPSRGCCHCHAPARPTPRARRVRAPIHDPPAEGESRLCVPNL